MLNLLPIIFTPFQGFNNLISEIRETKKKLNKKLQHGIQEKF